LAAIIVPATEFFRRLPDRIDRIQMNIAPVLDLYSNLEKYVNRTVRHLAAPSAPTAIFQVFFGILVVFFFLSGWTRLRRRTITSRSSFGGAMATARVITDVGGVTPP